MNDDWHPFYAPDGRPLSIEEFVALFPTDGDFEAAQRVASEPLVSDGEPIHVSTVWLGVNLSMGRPGPPLIFETMIFGGPHDEQCVRYATKMDALDGHARTVADLMAGATPWFLRYESIDHE